MAYSVPRLISAGWRPSNLAAFALLGSMPVAAPAVAEPRPIAVAASAKNKVEVPTGPLLAVVSLSKQRIRIYGSTGLLAESPVSTGMAGHRTPPGVFTVLQKNRYHYSNIYSNAPMPYMQRLTWSGVALHAGVLPGYPASHGCIRLPHRFASELWGITKLGTRIIVAPDDPTATPIEHARLPAPRLLPAPSGDASPSESGEPPEKGPELVSAAGTTLTDAGAQPASPKLLNPMQRARAMRSFIVKDAAAKTKAAKLAVETAAAKANEARRAGAALRAAEQSLAVARRRHETAARVAEAAAEEARKTASAATAGDRAREALAAAEGHLAAAERRTEEASLIEAVADDDAAAAAAAVIETENARREAARALKLSQRADEPISILVSRKAGKVFVRQAWLPIHEAPVTFTDAELALGTHVYLAMGLESDEQTVKWVSVSLPPSASTRPRHRGKAEQPAPASAPPSETAASALVRFELPPATRRFIEERLWTGATLIVSDNGASHETGHHTDFILLTR